MVKYLLTGARSMATLDLARHLHAAGHTIIACDTENTPLTRFSKACQRYYTIPSPRFATEAFNGALLDIVQREKIEVVIPNWEEILYVSRILDRFPATCEVFCVPFDKLNQLHNKYRFIKLIEELGLPTPKTVLIKEPSDLQGLPFHTPYALKACYSRGSNAVHKVYPLQAPPAITIDPRNPWVAQEWIEGKQYCTYSVCRSGKVLAHSTYPIEFGHLGRFAVTFRAVEHPGILEWTKKLVAAQGHTGQIAFDFIESHSGTLYAIECNPRITSGVHLFTRSDRLEQAFTGNPTSLITPTLGTRRQLLTGMLMFGWRGNRNPFALMRYLRHLVTTRDTVARLTDPLPFMAIPLLFKTYYRRSRRLGLTMANHFTHDVEWSQEPAEAQEEILAR
ncbi:MAG: ATP-grasp domain-containing protein [Parachlamydiales bacterium]